MTSEPENLGARYRIDACTPETPIGSCMVSSEGACAAHYNFGRLSKIAQRSSAVV